MVSRREVRAALKVESMAKGVVRVMVMFEAELRTIWLLGDTAKVVIVAVVKLAEEVGVVSIRYPVEL
jgi:hypothetical protein